MHFRYCITSIIVCFFLLSACNKDDNPTHIEIIDDYTVVCPEPPIELISSCDAEGLLLNESFLNFFSIIQLKDNLFYMYYEAFHGQAVDFEQTVSFAYSNDGIHWTRRFPNSENPDNVIIPNNITGVSVLIVEDNDYPFRMFGYCKSNNGYGLFMWKSKDGISFSGKKEVLAGEYDTQSVGISDGKYIRLYTRIKEQNGRNRKIAVAAIDLDGNIINNPKTLQEDYVYNSAASALSEKYDILFPTIFSSEVTGSDDAYVGSFIVDGYCSKRITNGINEWITESEPWMLVSPGIITINNEKYIAYLTHSWSHDSARPIDGVSNYKLLKILVY